MDYDFTKPPTSMSVYKWGKNKKAHFYFHQDAGAFAAFMFQSQEMQDYFVKYFSLTYHPEGVR